MTNKERVNITLADDRELFNGEFALYSSGDWCIHRVIHNRMNINAELFTGEVDTPKGRVRCYKFKGGAWWIDSNGLIKQ